MTLADLNGDGYPDIVVANRGDYPDPWTANPARPQSPHSELRLPQRRQGPLSRLRSAPDRIGDIHRSGGPRRRWRTRPVRPAPRWRPEHHFVERWERSFPDIYESWAGRCVDPHGRRRRLRWGRAARSGVHRRAKTGGLRDLQPWEPSVWGTGAAPGPPRPPYALAVADLNRDGRPDIVVGYVEMPGSVYYNTGPHSFHEVRWNDGKGTVYGLAFADFNGDGWPDIVAARSDAPNTIWFSTEPMPGR